MKRGQTATEYLIILAVVIIISLIVVGVLGGIPVIESSANKASQLAFQTEPVGISKVTVGPYYTTLTLENNLDSLVTIDNVTIGGVECYFDKDISIGSFKEKDVYCYGVVNASSDTFSHSVELIYTESKTSAVYTQDFNDMKLEGAVPQTQELGQTITLSYATDTVHFYFTFVGEQINLSEIPDSVIVDS